MNNYDQNSELPKIIKDKKYILVVGSLDPRKNVLKLIEAFIKENTDYFLVIVGDKNKVFAKHHDLSKVDNKKIIFTGYLNDSHLKACYENAECFFYPSLYEGFGIPPLEAIYNNTPVDQLILEFYKGKEEPNSGWIHASYNKEETRKQYLIAYREDGRVKYKPKLI